MNEIKRLQQLAGILNEIVVNNPEFKFFKLWKELVTRNLYQEEYDEVYIDNFMSIKDPKTAIEYLMEIDDYPHPNPELYFKEQMYFIKNGEYPDNK